MDRATLAFIRTGNTLYTNLLYIIAISLYHICRGILFLIAVIFHQSFLLNHPDHLLPTIICTGKNFTIHSITPSSNLLRQIDIPAAPTCRRWCHPDKIMQRIGKEDPIESAIILQGPLSGSLLRQGMIIFQQEGCVYIGEEIGRWITREDFILTISVNLDNRKSFLLFIPVDLFDRSNLCDDFPRSPLRTPISFIEATHEARRIQKISPSALSPV